MVTFDRAGLRQKSKVYLSDPGSDMVNVVHICDPLYRNEECPPTHVSAYSTPEVFTS